MEGMSFTCRGYGHIESGKVCQDASAVRISHTVSVAVVSDGHGGDRYFRSDRGAAFAVEVACDKVTEFMTLGASALVGGHSAVHREAVTTQRRRNDFGKTGTVDHAFRQLFASILFEWQKRVHKDAADSPLTDAERLNLKEDWITDFEAGVDIEKVYGCTLMAYACCGDIWIAFQIGDGKLYTMDGAGRWEEPVPWDERCFLNKTTSLSDTGAIDEFRYACRGDGAIPVAAMLASDGLDDSFGTPRNQQFFYCTILKHLVSEGAEAVGAEIAEALPSLSQRGSKDDMSLAMIYDRGRLHTAYRRIIDWQLQQLLETTDELRNRLPDVDTRIRTLSHGVPDRARDIELRYARDEHRKITEEMQSLTKRLRALNDEYHAPHP